MEKSTNSSAYEWGYEYYYGYVDPVAVDASKLKYNRCEFVLFQNGCLWTMLEIN